MLHGPPFQRPFTTYVVIPSREHRCTDLHFRGLSQRARHPHPVHSVARTSISEAFHNDGVRAGYGQQVARTSISEAFHNRIRYAHMWYKRCTDLHFRGLSQLTSVMMCLTRTLHGPPFQRPFTTDFRRFENHHKLHGPPFQRPFTTNTDFELRNEPVARTSISEAFHNLYASFPPVNPLFTGVS